MAETKGRTKLKSSKPMKAVEGYGNPAVNSLLELVRQALGFEKFADTHKWTRNYAHLCLREFNEKEVAVGLVWMKKNYPNPPMTMRAVYYGMIRFKQLNQQKKVLDLS